MKISIVTAVYNRAGYVTEAINSVKQQTYSDVEHVVIDGGSTDGTLEILQATLDTRAIWSSEPDGGIYDALNKGWGRATGDVIGLMHSDDVFAGPDILEQVAACFEDQTVDAVYGDLEYVARTDTNRVIRRWRSGPFNPRRLSWGWMPPHPTLFLRRSVTERFGGFDTRFRIAADYDAILRYFGQGGIRAKYIPRVLVKMRVGGESNRSLRKVLLKSREDYEALRSNRIGGLGALAWKNLSKLSQFF